MAEQFDELGDAFRIFFDVVVKELRLHELLDWLTEKLDRARLRQAARRSADEARKVVLPEAGFSGVLEKDTRIKVVLGELVKIEPKGGKHVNEHKTEEKTKSKTVTIERPSIVAKAFNRWLDEYENHPENFEQEWATMRRHLKEKADGVEPTYGEKCVGMLNRYIDELAVLDHAGVKPVES